MGIDHPELADDEELVAVTQMLMTLGASIDDLIDEDLGFVAAPLLIRPNATIEVSDLDPTSDAEFRRKTRIALGFSLDDHLLRLTPGEAQAFDFFEQLRDVIGEEELLALLRVVGNASGRIARSIISALRLNYETPIVDQTGSMREVVHAYATITVDMLPGFLEALSTIMRRHLASLASQPSSWVVDRKRAATIEELTIGFVDLVGFTTFTEQADAREFIDALSLFEAQVLEIVVENNGTLVKLIGDEAMFVAPTPTAGLAIARGLAAIDFDGTGLSTTRIGLAAGDVVAVGGDYYGTVVNTASRIVEFAAPNEIVATELVAENSHATITFESLGDQRIRGLAAPVELFRMTSR